MLENTPIFVSPSKTRIPVGVSPRLEEGVKEEEERGRMRRRRKWR